MGFWTSVRSLFHPGDLPAAHAALCAYDWPGNIRELANVLERAQILAEGDTITPDDLPENLGRVGEPAPTAGESSPVVSPDDLDRVLAKSRAYIQTGGKMATAEHRMRCQDGSYKWVLNQGLVTKRDEQGQPLIFTGLCADVSIHRTAQR